MTLKAFFEKYPRFSSLASVPGIKELYDFLCRPSTIDIMIHASENRRPAISAITRNIESAFHDKKAGKDGMNFKKNVFLKLFIGYVISLAMQERGYVKDRNKNLNPQESEYFSAGTLYIKNESDDELKEKARKFWKLYNVGEKVIKILENWHLLSIDKHNPYQVSTYTSFKSTALDFWPYSWIVEKYYSSRQFISIYQITIELERQHPGIIALSELEAYDYGKHGYQKKYRFFTMIIDNLPEYARERKIKLETAELPYTHIRMLELRFEGFKINDPETDRTSLKAEKVNPEACLLWRVSEPETSNVSEIKRIIENVHDEWDAKIFDESGFLDIAKNVLRKSIREVRGQNSFKFMSLQQLALRISSIKNLPNHLSFALLFKELARRIWRGEVKDVEIEFLSGRDISSLTYDYYQISGLSKYIPIFKYKS